MMTQAANVQDRTIIFLHIPKTAGRTLHRIIARQVDPAALYATWQSVSQVADEFVALPAERKKQLRVISGHVRYGLHLHMPQRAVYITLLRDPVERVISHYYYVLRHPEHWLHDEIMSNQMSLKDYVTSGICIELENDQVRLLSGVSEWPATEAMLEQARQNMQKAFAFVGLSERFDESVILLQQMFGWNTPYYVRANVGANRPRRATIPADTIAAIEAQNRLDAALYAYAREQFEELIRQQPESFHQEVARFRRQNRWYGLTHRLRSRLSRLGAALRPASKVAH
jgi:hypothetical protein